MFHFVDAKRNKESRWICDDTFHVSSEIHENFVEKLLKSFNFWRTLSTVQAVLRLNSQENEILMRLEDYVALRVECIVQRSINSQEVSKYFP